MTPLEGPPWWATHHSESPATAETTESNPFAGLFAKHAGDVSWTAPVINSDLGALGRQSSWMNGSFSDAPASETLPLGGDDVLVDLAKEAAKAAAKAAAKWALKKGWDWIANSPYPQPYPENRNEWNPERDSIQRPGGRIG